MLGIDKLSRVLQKPIHAVIESPALLARRQGQDQVAPGDDALLFELKECCRFRRGYALDFLRATAAEPLVFLRQFEGRNGPELLFARLSALSAARVKP